MVRKETWDPLPITLGSLIEDARCSIWLIIGELIDQQNLAWCSMSPGSKEMLGVVVENAVCQIPKLKITKDEAGLKEVISLVVYSAEKTLNIEKSGVLW